MSDKYEVMDKPCPEETIKIRDKIGMIELKTSIILGLLENQDIPKSESFGINGSNTPVISDKISSYMDRLDSINKNLNIAIDKLYLL